MKGLVFALGHFKKPFQFLILIFYQGPDDELHRMLAEFQDQLETIQQQLGEVSSILCV